MTGHAGGLTKDFAALSFDEQSRSILAAISELQAAIRKHVEQSPQPRRTIEECLSEVDRLSRELQAELHREEAPAITPEEVSPGHLPPRFHIRSPRLARPEQADDFLMEVEEGPRDASLRR